MRKPKENAARISFEEVRRRSNAQTVGTCEDHLGFWIAQLESRGVKPDSDAVVRLVSDRPDLDPAAVLAVGDDLQLGGLVCELQSPRARRGFDREEIRRIAHAFASARLSMLHEARARQALNIPVIQ